MSAHRDIAARVMERCDQLARISEEPDRLTRRFATPALHEAGEAVLGWMRQAGMSARRDAIGNVVGRYEGAVPGAPALLLGSHLDTVRDAGRYDGPLGVLTALACVERLSDEDRRLPFALEVLGFADEEGVRYGTAYLGSSVVAGSFDAGLLDRRDADGITMRDAIHAANGDPDRLHDEAREPDRVLGYCEVHLEQGPALEATGLHVGVVSGIAGQTRAELTFEGTAGHAGTVPMHQRRDALAAAAEWISAVESEARARAGMVATVGSVRVEPGASNVIPGLVSLSLDLRHPDDPTRRAAREELRARAVEVAARRGLRIEFDLLQESDSLPCSPELTGQLARAVAAVGHPVHDLVSGAGHDAVALSPLMPVAMLFVRCAGGVSHHPDEHVAEGDARVAIDVMGRFLDDLALG